jgi:hypothetical protein
MVQLPTETLPKKIRASRVWSGHMESAFRIFPTQLYSEEALRVLDHKFDLVQVHIYAIEFYLWPRSLDRMADEERKIKSEIESCDAVFDHAIQHAEGRLRSAGITYRGTEDPATEVLHVPVYSYYGKRYLQLIGKFDQMMLLLNALLIHKLVGMKKMGRQKARLEKEVEKVANLVRDLHKVWHRDIVLECLTRPDTATDSTNTSDGITNRVGKE